VETEALKNRFALVRLWPETPAAEHEAIARIRRAADKLGIEVVEVDGTGTPVGASGPLAHDAVDFVLHPHFESAKVFDGFSIGMLWNPLHFYFDSGFDQTCVNQTSHDAFVSCGSQWAEDLVAREWGSAEGARLPPLNHTLSGPVLPPQRRSDRRLFYCGINWERTGRPKGRHHDLLARLDAQGLVSIFGPRVLRGVAVWGDFAGYRGELPFDGEAVVGAIADCGVALVLSSDAHLLSDIMSSRLFEAMAAGAVIIAQDMPFVREHLGDAALYLDPWADPIEAADQAMAHLARLNADPAAAQALAARAQAVFVEKFLLDRQLAAVYEAVPALKAAVRRERVADGGPGFDIVLGADGLSPALLDRFVGSLAAQSYPDFILHVLDPRLPPEARAAATERLGGRVRFHDIDLKVRDRRLPAGQAIARIWPQLEGSLLLLADGTESFFHDFLGRMAAPFVTQEAALVHSDYVGVQTASRAVLHTSRRPPSLADATAYLAVSRAAYAPLRPFADYLDCERWSAFLRTALAGRDRWARNAGVVLAARGAPPAPCVIAGEQQDMVLGRFGNGGADLSSWMARPEPRLPDAGKARRPRLRRLGKAARGVLRRLLGPHSD
jgi:hypothetical protein